MRCLSRNFGASNELVNVERSRQSAGSPTEGNSTMVPYELCKQVHLSHELNARVSSPALVAPSLFACD